MIESNLSRSGGPKTIVFGSFKGMGDLLSASPVIAQELSAGNRVKLLLFPGPALTNFVKLIDFGPNRANLQTYILPVSRRLADFRIFFSQMSQFQPDLVWISPHAPRPASSWKLPLLLWFIKTLYWPKAKLAGADSEHFSALFDVRVPVDRGLPLAVREQTAYSMLENSPAPESPTHVSFIESIQRGRNEPPRYDLLIHPGANAKNRVWPFMNYASLIKLIPARYSIAVVGLEGDVKKMRQVLPEDRNIQFLTGTLEQAIAAIARARVVLSMDSGNAHFSNSLGIPTVALYGPTAPAGVIAPGGSVLPIYERKHPCQPCGKATCSQPEVYCMTSLTPETVANALLCLLEANIPVIALNSR